MILYLHLHIGICHADGEFAKRLRLPEINMDMGLMLLEKGKGDAGLESDL